MAARSSRGCVVVPSSREDPFEDFAPQHAQVAANVPAVQQDDLPSPGTVPSHSATRRSARVWQPSRQALENIVDEVTCLEENVEAVLPQPMK